MTTGVRGRVASAAATQGPHVRSSPRPDFVVSSTSNAEMQNRPAWYLDIKARPKAPPAKLHRSNLRRGSAPRRMGATAHALARRKKSSGPSGTTKWLAEKKKKGVTLDQAAGQNAGTTPKA